MCTKLKQIVVEGERFYFNLSFDVGEYDGGVWWLQVYNDSCNFIYDKPFASCMFNLHKYIREDIKKIIKHNVLYPKGLIL